MSNFYGTATVITTGARGSRYLDTSNVNRSVTEIEPRLVSYTWAVENRAETPVTEIVNGTYAMTVQFQFRYVFEQKISKVFNKSITGDAMSSGFDFSDSTTTSQTRAYPDPSELQVFSLPQILEDADFVHGDRKWHMKSYDITYSAETGVTTLQAALFAMTHWMKYTDQSSKCEFPPLSSIATAKDFPT